MADGGLTALDKLNQRPDPLLTFKWVCDSLPFGHPPEYVESVDLPFNNIGADNTVYAASGFSSFPGTHKVSAVNMTLYEDSKASTLKWLLGWKARIKDIDGTFGGGTGLYYLPGTGNEGDDSEFYKKTIKVKLLDTSNSVVATASLIGVWPTDTGNLSLNYTDGTGRIAITQSFSIDDIKFEF